MTLQTKCRITLLGNVCVCLPDREITRFRTHKTGVLLGCLALRLPAQLNRDTLLELFWPELETEAARNNLSTALSSLRAQLEPPDAKGRLLLADRLQVGLNPEAVVTDVMEFERFLDAARLAAAEETGAGLLEQALALYHNGLMPGCYDDWILPEQTRLRERCANALRQLAQVYGTRGQNEAALNTANRLIALDTLDEESYQIKMRLLLQEGRAAAAQETFEALKTLLQRELGVEPEETTRRLLTSREPGQEQAMPARVSTLRSLAIPEPPSAPPPSPVLPDEKEASEAKKLGEWKAGQGGSSALETQAASEEAQTFRPEQAGAREMETAAPLPLQLTRFFGRREELDRLLAWLQPDSAFANPEEAGAAAPRLVTLTGPGGAGKTRLALEAAARLSHAYRGRIRFVALADVPHPRLLSFALTHALRLPPAADPLEGALEWLQNGPSLLVLDNFEHLLDSEEKSGKMEHRIASPSAAWARLLLERAPGLTCLVTSRRVLGLQGEQELALSSLALPRGPADPVAPGECASVALYVDRAQQAKPDFALTAANAETIGDLCRRLEGMPLAIEMAAAWTKIITPHKMLERMEHQLDVLVSRRRDLPARHRSLRATCEWSYALLSEDLQRFFARLSVFPGGCTLESAEAVCGGDALEHLARLQEHSLLVVETPRQPEESARYRLLEPLRAFAAEKLRQGEDGRETQARFVDYFLEFIMALAPKMEEAGSGASVERLDAEHRNIMAALRGSLITESRIQNQAEGEQIQAGMLVSRALRAALELRLFFTHRGYHEEALDFFQMALALPELQQNQEAYSDLLSAVGNCFKDMARFAEAYAFHTRCLAIRQELGDSKRTAATLHNMGNALYGFGKDSGNRKLCLDAMAYLLDALQINRQMGNTVWEAYNLNSLGSAAKEWGDLELARRYYEQSLQLRREHKNIPGISHVLFNLGNLDRIQEDYDHSLTYFRDALTTSLESGDRATLLRTLDCMALIACRQQQWPRATILIGASSAALNRFAMQRIPEEQSGIEATVHTLCRQMDADAYSRAQQQGSAMSLEEIANFASSHAIV